MFETVRNIGWSMVFSLVGGLVGMALVLVASLIVPGLIDRLTPDIDEHKEIARGNTRSGRVLWPGGGRRHSWVEHCRGCRSAGRCDCCPALSIGKLTWS